MFIRLQIPLALSPAKAATHIVFFIQWECRNNEGACLEHHATTELKEQVFGEELKQWAVSDIL